MAWGQVGSIRKSEDKDDGTPGKLYIKFHQIKDKKGNYTSKNLRELADALENSGQKGVSLQIEKPKDKILKLASLGYIDEDKVEERLESVPAWLKYEIVLPPQNE